MNRVLFFLYIFFLLSFVVFSYLFIDPGLFYLRPLFSNFHQIHRATITILFFFFILSSFFFYLFSLYLIKKNKLTAKHLFVLIGVTIGILVFSYPAVVSFDIFNYIATAKVTYFYHENPYIIMPFEFIHDPLLFFMHAANKTALYAPFWILLTAIPYFLGFGNFLFTLFSFKLFVGLFYVATVVLLWKMTKSVLKTAFFALNPLVLFETFVGGHNDIVMMFFALLSLYFYLNKKRGWGSLFLLFSIGIKYATLFLLPVYIANRKRIFFVATIGMYVIFFLSAFREEIYPWYAIWFLVPVSFLFGNNLISWISLTFSFSLLLRYTPFMLLGTYFGPTPYIKIAVTFIPVVFAVLIYYFRKQNKIL